MDPENKPFDASDAAEADARDIAALVGSKGYQDFLLPFMLGLARRWYKELANPALTRKNARPDDFLRGGIHVIEALIQLPTDVLREQARRNQEEKEAQEVDEHYDRIARESRGDEQPYQGLSPADPV